MFLFVLFIPICTFFYLWYTPPLNVKGVIENDLLAVNMKVEKWDDPAYFMKGLLSPSHYNSKLKNRFTV